MDQAHALFAADAFYLAFANKDADAMDALWARRAPVCCVHPGWPRLTDRDEIMASWRSIFDNPQQTGPTAYAMRPLAWGDAVAVSCYEQLEGGVILATKVFVLEDGDCKLVLHQGSPCQNPPAPEHTDDSGLLQ